MSVESIEREFRDQVAAKVRLAAESPDRFRVFTPFVFDDRDLCASCSEGERRVGASAAALETDVSMAMTAVGTRGELIGARATGGFARAFKADALWVGGASDLLDGATGRLNASEAGVTRVRTALEDSRSLTLSGARLSLTPTVEVGLRRDGVDAETGAGMDVGGGLAFSDTVTGLSLDVQVRTLVVHQADGLRERGMSLSFGWDPTPSSPLGLTAKVAPSWGGQATGGADALWSNQMAYGIGSYQMYGSGCQATLKTDPLATPKTDPRRNGVCRSTTTIRGCNPRDGGSGPARPDPAVRRVRERRGRPGRSVQAGPQGPQLPSEPRGGRRVTRRAAASRRTRVAR